MFELSEYLDRLIAECMAAFGDRLAYVGLQGSYLRGEANEDSDIDVMVLIDRFCVADMDAYRDILRKIGSYEKSCGFICGRDEMARWNPLELTQLLHTTRDLYGTLADYVPAFSRADEINYTKLSLGNLYHEICHRYIHADREKNRAKLPGTCKGFFFVIQNLRYLETGRFTLQRKALVEQAPEEDRRVLALLDPDSECGFDEAFSLLFAWCQRAFIRLERL